MTDRTPSNAPGTRRVLPAESKPVDPGRVQQLLASEWERFVSWSQASGEHNKRAAESLPLGVTSSFQYWDPYPITVETARGAWLTDVGGNKLLDLSMGFGAGLVGHLNPLVVEEVTNALNHTGTLFVTPSPQATDMAERFKKRFDLDMLRFTNSGTESLMYAIRTARAYTRRRAIAKIEGGYHGGYDALQVSVKPALADIGPADNPTPDAPFDAITGDVHVVAYNDLGQLERAFREHGDEIAAFVVEPVIENLAIVLPDEGYLEGVRALCDQYGVVLIFDEVKTGLTAGHGGAAQRLGVKPDLITLAKSIGGGLPLAAFGGKQEIMDVVVDGRMDHFGTYNGNALVMAAASAVDKLITPEASQRLEDLNNRTLDTMDSIIAEYELPAHTVGLGAKGCVTWSTTPVRNYRDYKATDFGVAELSWLWGVNRGVLTPPGLDEQWLVSLAHTEDDMRILIEDFRSLAQELRA
ncbi:aspartate aminotransferase family protein [Leucobacter celer]|uniref:aspartate aminotransferase family protein n=1 Tax=Leucobacter celer TaxID=668625 RepID=UPI0006A77DDF|nr:aminotransferase class III-fold pyridoxal phosphate-dependent enzyme [Leucobacter celer]